MNFIGRSVFMLVAILWCSLLSAQDAFLIKGNIKSEGEPVSFAHVYVKETKMGVSADAFGSFSIEVANPGTYTIMFSAVGYKLNKQIVEVGPKIDNSNLKMEMNRSEEMIDEVVVTGTMKETFLKDSPIKVEVLSPRFLEKSPVNNVVEALQTVNGVQEQVNCAVCGTNDIQINGMDGPYTLVLIDGMPIVSALASVYGFNGIPNSLIERIEIIKGPASSLYGSEAVGGVINIITKDPDHVSNLFFNTFLSSHQEFNLDVGTSVKLGKKVTGLISSNYYQNQLRIDDNGDNFTDIPLNRRLSVFSKIRFQRAKQRKSSLALRFYTEDRFGGELQWQPSNLGGTEVYGENIKTNRAEVLGTYQLPLKENIRIDYSANYHDQFSYYGDTHYDAEQAIGFANFIWDKAKEKHNWLLGGTLRHQYYDDNSVATPSAEHRFIPGLFVQDEYKFSKTQSLLLGGRVDHHRNYGLVPAPRVAYKVKPGEWTTVRLNAGRGFRLVNLFTEDHAALTGARNVMISNELKPEQSYNANLNLNHVYVLGNSMGTFDMDLFYTYFTNKIIPDYDTDPNLIIYDNLEGNAVVRGMSASIDQNVGNNLKLKVGATYQDVYEYVQMENGALDRTYQLFVPKLSLTFANSYTWKKRNVTFDWIGRVVGPQQLPEFDEPFRRPTTSPWFTIQNFQITKKFENKGLQIYGAVRNIFNYTQPSPLIAPEAPFGDAFDTSYAYGPLQTRRFVIGIRYSSKHAHHEH